MQIKRIPMWAGTPCYRPACVKDAANLLVDVGAAPCKHLKGLGGGLSHSEGARLALHLAVSINWGLCCGCPCNKSRIILALHNQGSSFLETPICWRALVALVLGHSTWKGLSRLVLFEAL